MLGVIDVTGRTSKRYPDSLAAAVGAARAVEADLRGRMQSRPIASVPDSEFVGPGFAGGWPELTTSEGIEHRGTR